MPVACCRCFWKYMFTHSNHLSITSCKLNSISEGLNLAHDFVSPMLAGSSCPLASTSYSKLHIVALILLLPMPTFPPTCLYQ